MHHDVIEVSPRARSLLAEALVWDMVYPLEPWAGNDLDSLARLKAAGYDMVSLTVAGDDHDVGQAFERVAAARAQIQERSDALHLVEVIEDVAASKAAGKLGVGLHFEGTRCFGRKVDAIEAFVRLGVRHTLLAFNSANSAGSGCAEPHDGGLTMFGRRLVSEMQRVGMLLDLSHVGFRTSMDAMEIAIRPVMFSHSNVAALAPSFRNLSDEQIKACAATGGVIGLSGSSSYLGDEAVRPQTLFAHLDYIVQMVGPAHVGLGLDLVVDAQKVTEYARARPDEWPMARDPDWPGFRYFPPEQLPALVEQMIGHGYDDQSVKAILGGNHQRVCAAAWAA
jgi:membrane dipeptidase